MGIQKRKRIFIKNYFLNCDTGMTDTEQKNNVIEITTGTILRVFLIAMLLAAVYFVRDIVALVLFSIVIASSVEPGVRFFEKKRIPRVLSLLFIYFVGFLILATMFYMVVPNLVSELSRFAITLPQYLNYTGGLHDLFSFLPSFGGSFSSVLQDVLLGLQDKVSEFSSGFFSATAKVFGGVFSFFLIVVLSFYLAVQKDGLDNFVRIITPDQYEKYILNLWRKSHKKIGLWLQGQILLGLLVGVLVFLGLTILRVEYAFSFALLAAVFELIPIFGPIMASIPPVLVAFLQSPSLGVAVIILFVIIQQFENHLIYPLVVRKIIGIPPIISILAIIIGGKLGGFFGILLAVPMATVLMEFLNDLAERKKITNGVTQ